MSIGVDFGAMLFAHPRRLLVWGVRPFIETGVQIAFRQPDEFKGDQGGEASIEDTFRWRLGTGLSIPVTLASYTVLTEVSAHYGLTSAKLKVTPTLGAEVTENFLSHSLGGELGLSSPLGAIGLVWINLDLRGRVDAPIAGSAEASIGLDGERGVEFSGYIGLRATFSRVFGVQ